MGVSRIISSLLSSSLRATACVRLARAIPTQIQSVPVAYLSSSVPEPPVSIPPLPPNATSKIEAADAAYKKAYDELPTTYPEHALEDGKAVDAYRKRLLYRSKQRGWLEVDLMLGSWATRHLPEMNEQQLREYEKILNQETVDLFNMILGRAPIPPEMESPLLTSIMEYVRASPLGKASPTDYAKVKSMMSN